MNGTPSKGDGGFKVEVAARTQRHCHVNVTVIPEGIVVRASPRKIDGPFYIVISKMLREESAI